mgnify:CR=1 FL=1
MKHQASDTNLHSSFPATNWSWVAHAGSQDDAEAQKALALLCEGYWYPIYAFLRGKGHNPHEAEDLAQGFFERILRSNVFAQAKQEKGRLRNYLLTCLQNHVFAEHQAAMARKRGQGATHLPIHLAWAEERFGGEQIEPRHAETPEHSFNRRWWALVIEQAMQRVRDTYAANGELELYTRLAPLIEDGRVTAGIYEKLAHELDVSEQSLRVAMVRLKKRSGESIRRVLQDMVGDRGNVEDELAAMMAGKSHLGL